MKNTLELSKEKLDWLMSIGATDISKFHYMVGGTGHLYSLEYLQNTRLERIKTDFVLLYANTRKNKLLCNFRDNGNG